MANKVLRKYGTCKIEVNNHIARYFYQDENYNWIEVVEN
jgi:hypothetical protein